MPITIRYVQDATVLAVTREKTVPRQGDDVMIEGSSGLTVCTVEKVTWIVQCSEMERVYSPENAIFETTVIVQVIEQSQ